MKTNSYSRLLNQLRKDSFYIKSASLLFIFSVILGFIFPQFLAELRNDVFASILAEIEGRNYLQLSFFIIQNNLRTAFFGFLLGILLLPILALFINGFFTGSILAESIEKSSSLILWRLLPHGIFELPAIIISFAYGIKISLCWLRKNRLRNFKSAYMQAFEVFIYIVMPLIIVAGFIESLLFFI